MRPAMERFSAALISWNNGLLLSKRHKPPSQALTADSLLSKLVTGEFEERIEALERGVRELESAP